MIFNTAFYQSQFKKLDVYRQFQSSEQAQTVSQNVINFLCCAQSLNGEFFSKREVAHMQDVKNIISLVRIQFYLISGFLIVCLLLLFMLKRVDLILLALKWGSVLTIISIIFLWLLSISNFDGFFLRFHYLTFKNDFWLLPKDSTLIKLFPEKFFANFANQIALQAVIMSVVIYGGTKLLESRLLKIDNLKLKI